MKAWTSEADQINIGEIDTKHLDTLIVNTLAIDEFLHHGHNDKKLFIIAPKGVGKTLLLRTKSQMYRNEASGYYCIPEHELVEKFTANRVSFSQEELERFKTFDVWAKTWKLCLLITILKNTNVPLPAKVEEVIGFARWPTDILGALLLNRNRIERLYQLVPSELMPKVRNIRGFGNANQIALFLDNIDEFFEDQVGFKQLEANQFTQTVSEDVWINAQLAIISVAREICAANKHIKIFVSIRSEAFNQGKASTDLQIEQYTTLLTYPKQRIKAIFTKNVELTEKERLRAPDADDPIEQFIGFNTISHRLIRDPHDNPRKEDVFDYMYRHTFGRPREIVVMGKAIYNIDPEERTPKAVRDAVNSISTRLLRQYSKEIVPFFYQDIYDEFCELSDSNVVSFQDAKEISDYFARERNFPDVFSYFYRLGLIGITYDENANGTRFKQRFLPVGQYSLASQGIPEHPDYYVMHPAMNEDLENFHGIHFFQKDNLIGNEYPFHIPRVPEKKTLHTHIGINRDSLAIILPEFSRKKSIALYHPTDSEFADIGLVENVEINLSTGEGLHFKVIHDHMNSVLVNRILAQWKGGEHIIIYSRNKEILKRVLQESETISCFASDHNLKGHLSLLEGNKTRKLLYIPQRYLQSRDLKAAQSALEEHEINKVSTESILVDRYTHEWKYYEQDNAFVFDIVTEPYGRLIFRDRPNSKLSPGKVIIRTSSDDEQTYYANRQKLLVEGIYRMHKLIHTQHQADVDAETETALFGLFYTIQINRLLDRLRRETKRHIFREAPNEEIKAELIQFCKETRDRITAIPKNYTYGELQGYVSEARGEGIFPTDHQFYRWIRRDPSFFSSNQKTVLKLRNVLQIMDRRDRSSVFISYSYEDSLFSEKLHDSLKKRGHSCVQIPE